MRPLPIIAFGVILSGCAINPATFKINAGDSRDRVVELLGPPENRQFKGQNEALQYCVNGTSFGHSTVTIVWLHNQIVTSLNTADLYGSCQFKTIDWDNAPDRVIEIRKR